MSKIQHGGQSPFWQIEKSPYLRNGLANRRKILFDDAHWFSEPSPQFKNRLLENTRCRTAAILKKRQISKTQQRFHRIAVKFSTMTNFNPPAYTRLKTWFLKTKMAEDLLSNVQNRYGANADGVHIGATWRIRLYRPCAAAMRLLSNYFMTTCFLCCSRCVQTVILWVTRHRHWEYLFISELNNAHTCRRYFFDYNFELLNSCMPVWVFNVSLLDAALEHGDFLNTDISQGRVSTCLRYGGIFDNHFTANLLANLSLKLFWIPAQNFLPVGPTSSV